MEGEGGSLTGALQSPESPSHLTTAGPGAHQSGTSCSKETIAIGVLDREPTLTFDNI